ncbi:MAG: DNA-3-methyladenine glycosylase 2 family protein [Saprospiraceae bacterium]|nr:DNA-3-methyladenine glycosylase 2 family protein [Saprospiraceae bacterium]
MFRTSRMQLSLLNENNLVAATEWLADRDEALANVVQRYGPPPLWARKPDFSTLVHIILEQQVSLASANAAFKRLQTALGEISPERFLTLDDEQLRQIGFSRQKSGYARDLAHHVLDGRLNFSSLTQLPDGEVRQQLTRIKGIGDWTADIYLSECLLRPDILPKGDIAMLEAFRVLKNLPKRPEHSIFEEMTAHWRPLRSVGARLLWHFYLCERTK